MDNKIMKFDDTLSKIGGFGRYQKLLLLGFIIFYPGSSYQFTNINFLVGGMDHWCRFDFHSGFNKTYLKELIIPKAINEFGEEFYSKCEMYDVNITELCDDPVGDLGKLMPDRNWTRVPCNGWEFDRTEFYSTIVSQHRLVCDRSWLQTIPAIAYVMGSFCGSILAGYFSDRWGRKWTAVLMIIGQMLCNIAEAFSPYFVLFVGLRFLVGIWNMGAYSALWILVIENMPPVYRNHCTYFFTLGRILEFILPIIAFFVRNHIHLQIIGVGVAVPGLIYAILLPESPRWLLSRKRYKEYDAVVRTIAKINDVAFTEEMTKETSEFDLEGKDNGVTDELKERASFLNLLRTPRLRQRTLIVCFLWFSRGFVLYAFGTNIGKLVPGNIYLNMVLITAGSEVPTFLTIWFALFRSGRRLAMMIYILITGLCCLLMIPLIMVKMKLLVTIAAMIALAALKTVERVLVLYTGEIYPTPARTIGFGSAASAARIAALIATQLPLLKLIWFGLPYVFLSIFPIASSVLAYFLPETKGCHLPETFEEAEMFGTRLHGEFEKKSVNTNDSKGLSEPFITDAHSEKSNSDKQI